MSTHFYKNAKEEGQLCDNPEEHGCGLSISKYGIEKQIERYRKINEKAEADFKYSLNELIRVKQLLSDMELSHD